MQGSFPVEAFGHRPSAPGVPVIFYRATATNPARTIDRWREVAPELVDVEIEGRHRGFASIMHAPRVEEIAADLADRISGRRPLQPASD
jgi:thioesterase domain-containing protein